MALAPITATALLNPVATCVNQVTFVLGVAMYQFLAPQGHTIRTTLDHRCLIAFLVLQVSTARRWVQRHALVVLRALSVLQRRSLQLLALPVSTARNIPSRAYHALLEAIL